MGERLGEGVNPKLVSCITPSPSLSPKGERSMRERRSGVVEGEESERFEQQVRS